MMEESMGLTKESDTTYRWNNNRYLSRSVYDAEGLEKEGEGKNSLHGSLGRLSTRVWGKGIFPISFSQSVQSLSCVWLFATPWLHPLDAMACKMPGLPVITNSRSLLKLMSTESVMPSNHLILCHPCPLLPSVFPSIRVFSNKSTLYIRRPKYWHFSFSIHPSSEY